MSDDHAADVQAYIDGVTTGKIVTGRLQRLAVWRHLDDLKLAGSRGFYFDEQIAVDCIEFSLCCYQFDGEWEDLPLMLRGEQKFIAWCLFGWRQVSDGLRRFRQAQIECARKWGKSTYVGYICNLLLYADFPPEPGAQIYVAATKQEQAKAVWESARQMIERSPELAAEAVIRDSQNKTEILLPASGAKFRPLASDTKKADGYSPHCIVKDEEHAYRGSMVKFVNTLKSGFGARRQPLTVTITTYGDDESDIWQKSHDYAVACLESVITGEIYDDTWFVFIAAIDYPDPIPCFRCQGDECSWCSGTGMIEPDKPYDEACWIKANPGIGQTPKWERMRDMAREAKNGLGESEFFQKNLNIVVSSKSKIIPAETWALCKGEFFDWSTANRIHGASDTGRSNDMGAGVAMARFDMTDDEGVDFRRFEIRSRAFTCKERDDEIKTPQVARWCATGQLNECNGDQILFSDIEDWAVKQTIEYGVRTWAYDPSFGSITGQRLKEVHGLTVFPFSQNAFRYNAPTRLLKSLLTQVHLVDGKPVRALCHDGDPVLAWMMTNLIVVKNAKDEWMPDKGASPQKIDLCVATIMALSECVFEDNGVAPAGKFYETNELEIV